MKKRKRAPAPNPAPRLRADRPLALLGLLALLTAHAPVPQSPTLTITGGDAQIGNPAQPYAQPLKVQLKDEFGVPVPGAPVTFTGLFLVPDLDNGTISTSAGGGNFGDGGPAVDASLANVFDVAALSGNGLMTCTPDGSFLVADAGHALIRKVDPSGIISTVAGNGRFDPPVEGAPALQTSVGVPASLACDGAGNIFFADLLSLRIRRIDATAGTIATVAGNGGPGKTGDGGPAVSAEIGFPIGLAFDASGNLWFTTEYTGHHTALRKVDSTGVISTLLDSDINSGGLAVEASGSILFCDPAGARVASLNPSTLAVTTFAGDGTGGYSGDGGPATSAQLLSPRDVDVAPSGDVYIIDPSNFNVRRVDPTGIISTFAGAGGPSPAEFLAKPTAAAVDAASDVLIATTNQIYKISAATGDVSHVAGSASGEFSGDGGPATLAGLGAPRDAALDSAGLLYLAETGNGRIRRIDPSGVISTVLGNGADTIADGAVAASVGPTFVRYLDVDSADRVVFGVDDLSLYRFDPILGTVSLLLEAATLGPSMTLLDAAPSPTGDLYVLAFDASTNETRLVKLAAGVPTAVLTLPGAAHALDVDRAGIVFIGRASEVLLFNPHTDVASSLVGITGVAVEVDPFGHLYVARGDQRVYWVNRVDGSLTPVAGAGTPGFSGDGGPALLAQLAYGTGIAVEPDGDFTISDTNNDRLRAVAFPEKTVTEFTVFTDLNGFASSPTPLGAGAFGPQPFAASATVGGQTVSANFSLAVGPPQGSPIPPNPDHADRPLTNDPARLNPRWSSPTPAFFVVPPPAPAAPPAASHQRIVLDSKAVVHSVDALDNRVWYVNNRWESRRSNGFCQPFQLSASPTPGGTLEPSAPACAIDPSNDSLHVAWLEKALAGSTLKQRIVYRKLSQNPAAPGWSAAAVAFEVEEILVGDPQTIVFEPHIAVGADHNPYVSFITSDVVTVTQPNGDFTKTTVRRVRLWTGSGAPGTLNVATLTHVHTATTDTFTPANLFMPRETAVARRDGAGAIHVAWDEFLASDDGAVTSDEEIRRVHYAGPAGDAFPFTSNPGDQLLFDFDAGADLAPQFVFETLAFADAGSPQNAALRYRYGVGGPLVALATQKVSFTQPLVGVDSRNRPHVIWTAFLETPDAAGYSGAGLAYGRAGSQGAAPWSYNEPLENPHQGTSDFQPLTTGPAAMTVCRLDAVHVVAGTFYARAFEPNLGAQDAALTVPIGPGASACVATGNLYQTLPALSTSGVGFAVNFSLVYNSQEPSRALLAPGWQHNYHVTLTDHVSPGFGAITDTATIQFGDGHSVLFRRPHGAGRPGDPIPPYLADAEFHNFSRLERLTGDFNPIDGSGGAPVIGDTLPDFWRLVTKSGTSYLFDSAGRLIHIFDTQVLANKMTFDYGPIPGSEFTSALCAVDEQVLLKITDSAPTPRSTLLFYTPSGTPGLFDPDRNRLCRVQDPAGHTYEIVYNAADLVDQLKFPLPDVAWSFKHHAADDPASFARKGLLSEIRTPRVTKAEVDGWKFQYFPDDRFAKVTQPAALHANDAEPFATSSSAATIVVNYSDETSTVTNTTFHHTTLEFERRRAIPLKATEPTVAAGQQPLLYAFFGLPGTPDGHRNLASLTDRRGFTTTYAYFASGPSGFEYVRDNLHTVTRPGGPVTEYLSYSSFNLPDAVKDPEGHVTSMTYESETGNLLSRHLPTTPILEAVAYVPSGLFDTLGGVSTQNAGAIESWSYDSFGRVDTYTAPNSAVTEYFYDDDATGLVTSIKRPAHTLKDVFTYDIRGFTLTSTPAGLGTTTFMRDALARVTHTIEPTGDTPTPTTVTTYDLDSNVKTVQSPKGAVTEYEYDLLGRRTQTIDKAFSPNRISDSFFDRRGNLRRAGDFKSQFADTLYNPLNWTIETIARDGARVTYVHDPSGNLLSMTELGVGHPSRTTTHLYDERNNRTEITHADPTVVDQFVYDLDDLMTASGTFHNGALVTGSATTFNARHLAEATMQIPAGGSLATPVGSPLANHITTSFFYDLNANLRAVRDHLQHVTQTTYDAADRPDESIDARGHCVSKRSYEEFDAVHDVSVPNPVTGGGIDPVTGLPDLIVTRTNLYNGRGEMNKAQDALTHAVSYKRDADGLVESVEDQDKTPFEYVRNTRGWVTEEKVHTGTYLGSVTTKFDHDPNGNVTKITDPNNHAYTLAYDSRDRLISLTTPHPCTETWVFNEFGEVETYTDANGKVTTFTRNTLGLVTNEKHVSAGGTVADITVGYQDGFIPNGWTDATTGVGVNQALDALRRVTNVQYTMSGTPFKDVDYAYNPIGWLDKVTDPEEVDIVHERDANGQLRKVTRGPVFAQMSYDVGNRLQHKDYNSGATEDRTYTERGQVDTIVANTSGGATVVDLKYKYDKPGNPKSVNYKHLKVDADYQHLPGLYWLASETYTPKAASPVAPKSLAYVYDPAGNRTQKNDNGVVTTNTHDADNRLVSQSTPGGLASEVEIAGSPIADSGSPVTAINDANYLNEWSTTGAGQHFAGVSFLGNESVEKLVCHLPNEYKRVKVQTLLAGVWSDAFVVNTIGASPSPTAGWWKTNKPVVTFEIAPVTATAVRLLMDAGGAKPPATDTMRVNELDPFTTVISSTTSVDYTWDCNGNQLTRKSFTGGALSSDEAFSYDYANRLASYVKADGLGAIQSSFVYGFTPLGDRLHKTNTMTGVGEFYMHSMGNVIADYAKSMGGSPTLTSSYFAADGLDTQIARIVGGAAEFYHGDRLGTVLAKSNDVSTITAKYLDDAWGNRLHAVESLADRYGYTQREKDTESGLMHFRARAYAPDLGRFAGKDPDDPLHQHYAYVGNSPLSAGDPSGRQPRRPGPIHVFEDDPLSWWDPQTGAYSLATYHYAMFGNISSISFQEWPPGPELIIQLSPGARFLGGAIETFAKIGFFPISATLDLGYVTGAAFGAWEYEEGRLTNPVTQLLEGRLSEGQGLLEASLRTTGDVVTFGVVTQGAQIWEMYNLVEAGEMTVSEFEGYLAEMAGGHFGGLPFAFGGDEPIVFRRDRSIQFGQRRIDPSFSKDRHVPFYLRGKSIDEVAAALKTGFLKADDLPIMYFEYEGKYVSANNRSLAALAKAGLKPTKKTKINLKDLPAKARKALEDRLKEEALLPRQKLPGKWVVVTRSRTNLEIVEVIHLGK